MTGSPKMENWLALHDALEQANWVAKSCGVPVYIASRIHTLGNVIIQLGKQPSDFRNRPYSTAYYAAVAIQEQAHKERHDINPNDLHEFERLCSKTYRQILQHRGLTPHVNLKTAVKVLKSLGFVVVRNGKGRPDQSKEAILAYEQRKRKKPGPAPG